MIAQAEQQGVPRENPSSSTMVRRLRDFRRIKPPIYTRPKTTKDLEEECRASMFHNTMNLTSVMVDVLQIEESKKRKHTRARNMSRQAERILQGREELKLEISPDYNGNLPQRGVKFFKGSLS